MRRVICVLSLCITAQFGITAAHASTDTARPMIDEIFESTFAEEEAQPKAQEPAVSSTPVSGTAGQSLTIPVVPELNLPKPAPVKVSLDSVVSAGRAGDGSSGESSREDDVEEPEEPRAERSTAAERAGARRVSSTAYCLTGTMASGRRVYRGAVAMNGTPLGSRYQVLDGPRAGETFVVEDRIGYGSAFDIAYPGDCGGAYSYGRRTISIRPV